MPPGENEEQASHDEQVEWEGARQNVRAIKYEHQLKSQAVEIERLREKLRIAERALTGFGLKFVDEL